jgi:hypothetical protein
MDPETVADLEPDVDPELDLEPDLDAALEPDPDAHTNWNRMQNRIWMRNRNQMRNPIWHRIRNQIQGRIDQAPHPEPDLAPDLDPVLVPDQLVHGFSLSKSGIGSGFILQIQSMYCDSVLCRIAWSSNSALCVVALSFFF